MIAFRRKVQAGNYFDVLGVDGSVGRRELKRAYFRMSKIFHPDRYYQKEMGSFRPWLTEIFETMSRALSLGVNAPIDVETPFITLHKADVIRLGVTLGVRFELTLSCMQPVAGRQCGRCSKCRERADAFAEAGLIDPACAHAP